MQPTHWSQQCNTMQYREILYDSMRYRTCIHVYNTMQHLAIPCNTRKYHAIEDIKNRYRIGLSRVKTVVFWYKDIRRYMFFHLCFLVQFNQQPCLKVSGDSAFLMLHRICLDYVVWEFKLGALSGSPGDRLWIQKHHQIKSHKLGILILQNFV